MSNTDYQALPKLTYTEAKPDLRTGDILLCNGNHPIALMIKKFTNSIFSHVGFIFTWNNRVLVLESVEDDGVRAVPLSQYVYDHESSGKPYDGELYIARHQTHLDEKKVNKMLGHAADLLNKRYDKDEIAKIIWRIVSGSGRHESDNEYICSEFVEVCFNQIGISFEKDREGYIYPNHIAQDPKVDGLFQITAL
jgi:hypothetical protein